MDEKALEKLAEQVKTITGAVGELAKGHKAVVEGMNKQQEFLKNLSQLRPEDKNKPEDDDTDDDFKLSELESLSRADFMKMIVKTIEKGVNEKVKGVSGDVEKVRTALSNVYAKSEIDKAKGRFPDWEEWQDELTSITQRNPGLTLDDAYLLARGNNPQKAKEIDEKAKKAEDERLAAEKRQREEDEINTPKEFGGLLPTSGKASDDESIKDINDAADAAWTEVFGRGGGPK